METKTIGLMSPGDMGSGVGRALIGKGLRVVTDLSKRSARTRGLCAAAGLEDAGSLAGVVHEADLLLSIMPPASARSFAREAVEAMRTAGRTPPFADCNAISPMTTREIEGIVTAAGAAYIDGGIIGPPPGRGGQPTRLYVSGRQAGIMDVLACETLKIVQMGPEIGKASAQKMLYSALNKGTWALQTAVLLAGERFGLLDELLHEIEFSQKGVFDRMNAWVGFLAVDAHRWHPEMVEIAETFASVDVTPRFHEAAEDVYRLLSETPLAAETRETWDRSRSLAESIRIYSETLTRRKAAE